MRRRQLVTFLGGTALAPLSALSAPLDRCGVPVARDDGWAVASHDDALIDREALCRMADRIATSTGANVHGVMVARHGKLAFEQYFKGSDEVYGRPVGEVTFDVHTLNDMRSVSKSVASLVVGIAIDRGLIRGVNEPIFSFFPELSDLRSPEKDRIQLVHALTMSMGLAWVEATPGNKGNNDEERMNAAPDPCRHVLSLEVTAPAGQDFFYNTGALRLLSTIVRKATGQPLDEFARTALFEPLGITEIEWFRVKGDTDAGSGLRLRPREMAKIGQLVLNGGRWNDRQIVSKAWIDDSITPHIQQDTGLFFYGYLWWLGRSLLGGREIHWIGAFGRGGSRSASFPNSTSSSRSPPDTIKTTARGRSRCRPAFSGMS